MRKSFLTGLLLIISQPGAHAYCNRLPRLICAEYANADVVVIAKLVATKHYAPRDKQDWNVYTLKPDKVLRGGLADEFRVYEENSSGRATFDWIRGESYLLFLTNRGDGLYWLYGCGNSSPLKHAKRILDAIDSMKSRKGSFVQGIVGQTGKAANFKQARITIESKAQTYRAALDSDGKFGVHVPAGRYVIRVSLPGWSFEKDPLDSYEDPAAVTVEDGSCAEVSFTAERKP